MRKTGFNLTQKNTSRITVCAGGTKTIQTSEQESFGKIYTNYDLTSLFVLLFGYKKITCTTQ